MVFNQVSLFIYLDQSKKLNGGDPCLLKLDWQLQALALLSWSLVHVNPALVEHSSRRDGKT